MYSYLHALIIEPNNSLIVPYRYLDEAYSVKRFSNEQDALKLLKRYQPDIVFISASLSPKKTLQILEAVKNKSITHLIPVIFVVDYKNRINIIPGTTWAGKIGILDSFCNEAQFVIVTDRIFRLVLK